MDPALFKHLFSCPVARFSESGLVSWAASLSVSNEESGQIPDQMKETRLRDN